MSDPTPRPTENTPDPTPQRPAPDAKELTVEELAALSGGTYGGDFKKAKSPFDQ